MANDPEPSLEELLDDPIVRLLMAADGVRVAEVKRLLRSIQNHRRAALPQAASTASSRRRRW